MLQLSVHLRLYLNTDLMLDPSIPCCPRTAICEQADMSGPSCTKCWPRNLQPLGRLQRGSLPRAACLVLGRAVCSSSSQLLQPASSHLFPLPVTLEYQHLSAVAHVLLIKTWSLPLADDSRILAYKEMSHPSLVSFYLVSVHVFSMQAHCSLSWTMPANWSWLC